MGTGKRRRLVQRAESRGARLQLGLATNHGTASASLGVPHHRDHDDAKPADPFAPTYFGLQQLRWSPENISRNFGGVDFFRLRGSQYSPPEFTWKYEVAPGAIGFVRGNGLGAAFEGDLIVAGATPLLDGGHLFRFELTRNRRDFEFSGRRLRDGVADNIRKWEITESESLLIGRNFGVGTDIHTGPNGNLFIVSLTQGAIYEIFTAR